jgi:hypothetical protein
MVLLNEIIWRKQNGVLVAKRNAFVMVLGNEICDQVQRRHHAKYREQAPNEKTTK